MIKGNEPINSIPDLNNHPSSWYGLTKREYFSAMAMQGLSSNLAGSLMNKDTVSYLSVKYADALIAELNKPVSND
jgi:hypothetical protein